MPAIADVFGITGVSLILLAFFLNLFNRISQQAYAYILMNLAGGILACISSVMIQSVAFTILEGTWAAVSAVALYKKPLPMEKSSMPGETDLSRLIRQIQPRLNGGEYVFCSLSEETRDIFNEAIATFREQEGLSIIVPRSIADRHALTYSYVAGWITLEVYSALEAVGLTATVATSLAARGISCNVVAALHHDHLFVPFDRAEEALSVLKELAQVEP